MVQISLPDDEINDLLSAQILAALSEDTRTKLVEAAIKHLITPDRSPYGNNKETPMQSAFNQALTRLSHKIADEVLAASDAGERLRASMVKLIDGIPDFEYDWDMQTAIFRAIIEQTQKERS